MKLSDGSVLNVENHGGVALISREVDGRCVWGQAFSFWREEHDHRVAEVVADIQARPADFHRWDR